MIPHITHSFKSPNANAILSSKIKISLRMQGLKNYLPLPFGKAAASIVSSKATINMMKITPFPTNKLPNGTPDALSVLPAVCTF